MKNIFPKILPAIFIALILYGLFVFASGCMGPGTKSGFIEISGRLEGREYNVGTKVSGRVDEIYIKEGQVVEAGELLAVIYSKQSAALYEAAEARLKEAKANFDLAKIEYDRYERLFKASAVAKMEFDYVENRFLRAREAMTAAQKEVDKLGADIEDTKIVAPLAGTIVTKVVRKGEVVAAGTPIATIINMDDLYLKVFLTTELAGKVSLGDEARIYPDALPGKSFDAYVEFIGEKAEFTPKNVETKSQRAKLVFEIKLKVVDNKERFLKPGMPCDSVIKIDRNVSWQSYRKR